MDIRALRYCNRPQRILLCNNQIFTKLKSRDTKKSMLNWHPSFLLAAFTTTTTTQESNTVMKTTAANYSGWIVPRILPSTRNKEQKEFISSIHSQTDRRRIEPTMLREERGLAHHPFAPNYNAHEKQTLLDDTLVMDYPITIDENSESTTLDVYLFPKDGSSTASDEDSLIHVHLDRSSKENVTKTLQRIVLSLKKKLIPKDKNGDKQTKKGPQDTSNMASIWKVINTKEDTNSECNQEPSLQEWDVDKCTNFQVWKEAITTPLVVKLNVDENTTLSLPVDACPPSIVTVETFEDFSARVFTQIPLVLDVQSIFATHVCVDWFVGDKLVCSDSPGYTPQDSDIGQHLSVLVTPVRNTTDSRHSGRGYEETFRFEHAIEHLPENTVVKLREGDYWTNPSRRQAASGTRSDYGNLPLRVLTFNILADQNAYDRDSPKNKKLSAYPYVDESILDKARRMPLILHEVLAYQADIICLQEVDTVVWERLFRPVLEHQGYQGYFSVKTSETHEGCAMLWSLDRFESVLETDFKDYAVKDLLYDAIQNADERWASAPAIRKVLEENPGLKNIVDTKLGQVVQLMSLPLRKDDKNDDSVPDRILVGNTHLFYHPDAAHIRLMQMFSICRQFEKSRENHPFPMVLCGDMNSSLRRAAGYLLMNRKVVPDHPQIREHFNVFRWGKRGESNSGDKTVPNDMRIEHLEKDGAHENHWNDFPAIELPDHFPTFSTGYPIEPKFTHYLPVFSGSLDHIFVSQASEQNPFGFEPLRSAPMPTVADVTENVGMPSEKLPSDHISLVADLTFAKR